ncbi:HNH endonuclease, partial [Synechocystis salina]
AVHHCDYDPGNNSPSNLMALCSPCHLHYHRRQQGNISPGQLSLEFY